MRPPRFRFTVRRLMLAVAVAGLFFGWFAFAAKLKSRQLVGPAVTLSLLILLVLPAVLLISGVRFARRQADDWERQEEGDE